MQGFYTVYSTVFQKLAEEERQAAAAQSDQQDRDTAANLPAFGMLLALTHVVTSSPSTFLIYHATASTRAMQHAVLDCTVSLSTRDARHLPRLWLLTFIMS